MGQSSKNNENVKFSALEEEEKEETLSPDLTPVSDNSQSTTDSFIGDENSEQQRSLSSCLLDESLSSDVPSTVVRRDDHHPKESVSSTCSSSNSLCLDTSNRTSSSSIGSSLCRHRHHVSFGTVEMKEFAMILGDHPDTEDGPALTIDWTPQSIECDTVDHYEESRPPRRRNIDALKVAPFHREMYLQRVVGISRDEMETSIRAAKDVRRKREETVRKMKNEKFELVLQSFQRKTSRLFFGNPKTTYPTKSNSVIESDVEKLAIKDDKTAKHDKQKEKDSISESPRSRGRRNLLRMKAGSNSSMVGSCPDLSASRHPLPSTASSHRRRLASFENHNTPATMSSLKGY